MTAVTAAAVDEAHVLSLCEQLLAELDPKQTDAGGVPRPPVRPRAGVGPLPRGLRRPRRVARSSSRSSTRRLHGAGAPVAAVRNVIGYGMGAPTVVTHGTEEQKERYLRPLFTGEEVWCQLFSEPGAGSDVAGLAHPRRARRRRVDRQRPEGLDDARPPRPVGDARRPHRSRRAEAQGHDVLRRRHARARRRGPAAVPDHRRGRVQRGLLHRRPHPRHASASATSATAGGSSLTTLMNERVAIGGSVAAAGRRLHRRGREGLEEGRPRPTPPSATELMKLWVARRGAAAHEHPGVAAARRSATPAPRARSARSRRPS